MKTTPQQTRPGKGFRWVKVGEVLRRSDQWLDLWGEWVPTNMAGLNLTNEQNIHHGPYRRRTRRPAKQAN